MDYTMPQTNFEKVIAYLKANNIEVSRAGSDTLVEELDVCIKSINNLAVEIRDDWTFSNDDETFRRCCENLQDLQLAVYTFWALAGNNVDAMLHDRLKYKVGMTESVKMRGELPNITERVRDYQENGGY